MLAHVDNRITYSGNGNATEFAYQFKILDRMDIKVLLTDADGKEKLLTKDYYVDVEKNVVRYPGYAVGAEVPESERPPVLPTGWKLTIYREVPVTQETDLPDQYPFNQVEDIGDKLTMIAQQLTDTTGRSLKIGVSKSTDIDTTIPWENGKSFRISDDGKTLELSEDPARVLPLAQGVYAQTQAQAQSAAASATAAAKSEDSAFESAGVAGNSAQYASLSAASAAENAELTSGYKQEALNAKADATASATNAKASEANAKISENNAEASKEAAQSAASNANNFATSARSSASEAKSYRDAANNYAANAKNYSENVNVFLPSVSASGVLSWTNKAGLANPASVNIKGAKGDTGTAASIKIGSVTTGAAGSNASVTNSGTASNAVFDFVLPKGKDGADGGVTVDDTLSDISTNPVQNKVVKSALDNRAVLDESNTFTSPNRFDDIYMADGMSSLKWYNGSANFVVASITSERYTGEANTAKKATQDGAGNIITDTYTKKADFDKIIGDLGVAFQEKVDRSDLADVATSGKYTDLLNKPAYVVQSVNNVRPDDNGNVNVSGGSSNITIDTTLSAASTNAIANRTVYNALSGKLDKTGTAEYANKDSAGNVITDTYAKKSEVSGVVKSVNGTKPDASGNVTIAVSGGGGVSTSESNTWTGKQTFQKMKFNFESYNASRVSGATDNPAASVAVYNVQGNFTLDMSVLAGLLSNGDATLFTANITANGSYTLSITNAGTLKYVGSASDLAITANGLLLNIMLIKSSSGDLSSIVQASTLA